MAGYLCKAFSVDFRKKESPFERDQRLQREQQLTVNQNTENQRQHLKDKFKNERNSIIDKHLESLGQKEKDVVFTQFLDFHMQQDWFRTLYEKRGFDDVTTQGVWFSFIASKYLPEKWHSFEAYEATLTENSSDSYNYLG